LLAAGCSDPQIDASTEEAMKASSQRVRERLPEFRRAEFDEALHTIRHPS
jgi:hypothetical protein